MNNKLVKDYIEMNGNKLIVGMLRGKRVLEVKFENGLLKCGDTEVEYNSSVSVKKNVDKLCKEAIKELMQSNVKVLSYSII